MSNTTYIIHQGNPEDYRVINQSGVKQAFTDEPLHNACWDANLSPDGTLYFSVCSELTTHEYAKLYKYDFDTNTVKECFYTKDYFLKSDRYIRDSKFHTSIQFKPDGKLIMVTHTTDKAPQHIAWLPLSFVSNPFEGFAGGELLEYDPKTGKVDLFGIPAPRESIYGAVYSPYDDAYYMLGWMRGHLYRFDCKTRKVRDLGQATEYRSYRIVLGPDENVYFSTKSGFMMRYNVHTQRFEDLDARIPCDKTHKGWKFPYTYLGPCATGPDGRLYVTGNNTDILSALDPKTGKIEAVGKLFPSDLLCDDEGQHGFVSGMDFDRDGVLWFATMSFRYDEGEYFKVPSMLGRWDFRNGNAPEILGVFGTVERAQTMTDNLIVDKERDILYSVSTNHNYNSPDVIAIDLSEFRKAMHIKGDICRDDLIYAPGTQEYKPFADSWHDTKVKIAKYAPNIKAEKIQPVRLWREFSTPEFSEMPVCKLWFTDENTVEGICGKEKYCRFVIRDGVLEELTPIDGFVKEECESIANLPSYPGRQWRANAVCKCDWTNGAQLAATEDGMLARVNKDGSVYSIGPAIAQGPVRDICSSTRAGVAYGVGGDPDDVGNLFSYTEKEGLKYLGVTICDRADDEIGTCASFYPTCCAVSESGERVAVGVGDRLSCVYIYTKPYTV